MLTTTFRELKKAGACKDRYKFLRKQLRKHVLDTPISIKQIIEICGNYSDVIWALVYTFDRCDILINLVEYYIEPFESSHNHSPISCIYGIIFEMYKLDNSKNITCNLEKKSSRYDGYEQIFNVIAEYWSNDNISKELLKFCERA